MGVLDKFLNAMKLNDDYDDDGYLDDEIDDDFEEERPKKHFFKKTTDDFDDLQDDFNIKETRSTKKATSKTAAVQEKSTAKPAKTLQSSNSKVSPIRPRRTNGMEVCVIRPKSMEDAPEITGALLSNCTIVLNMEGLDLDLAQRIFDFASGSCYAVSGTLQKVSSYIFIITPSSVDVSGDIQEILSGIDVPSMHNRF